MIAPNIAHLITEPQTSVTEACEKSVAKKPPRLWW